MKIAGVPSDMEDIVDIEEIIKVSVIAQRMKNLPCRRKTQKIIGKTYLKSLKEEMDCNPICRYLSLFSVKGLN